MVGCTKRVGAELRISPQCEKVLAYCEARERRGGGRKRDLFGQTSINIPTQGQKDLEAVLGLRSYLEEYVSEKADDWVGHVLKPAEFAATQPRGI